MTGRPLARPTKSAPSFPPTSVLFGYLPSVDRRRPRDLGSPAEKTQQPRLPQSHEEQVRLGRFQVPIAGPECPPPAPPAPSRAPSPDLPHAAPAPLTSLSGPAGGKC